MLNFLHLFATLKADEKGLKKAKLLLNMSACKQDRIYPLAPF